MSDDMHDHGLVEVPQPPVPSAAGAGPVPLAEPLAPFGGEAGFTPDPEGPEMPRGIPLPAIPRGWPPELGFPETFKFCQIDLKEGCYGIQFSPGGLVAYQGTLRVDKAGGTTTISGDLYRYYTFPTIPLPAQRAALTWRERLALAARPELELSPPVTGAIVNAPLFRKQQIPIYPRSRYYSYLKVTGVRRSPFITRGPCTLTLTAEEYVYTQPPAGSFNGSFPSPPGTRTVEIVLEQKAPPALSSGPYFEGRLYEGGADKGAFTMQWVSKYFRRATLEIDTLTGSVAPQPVPAISGSGTESFETVFAKAGWRLTVVYDQTAIPVPAGVNATDCWSSANLHALMLSVRKPTTDLDKEWRMHLVVVPAKMGCGRGVMYDQIGVPREGVASFSDDGYPASQSANFGTAAGQKQRDVPRAFMRSATHEVGHGFNQIHQEQEGGADNSIMTTTPSVADVLGGPATGGPGVFPDQINLSFNEHVRHHLVHFPDIVVRPGGMTFGSGHTSTVPEADRYLFDPAELELTVQTVGSRIALGEPLRLSWTLQNHAAEPIPVPTDIGVEAQHAFVSVTTPSGKTRAMPSFEVRTDRVSIADLAPGNYLEADTRLYWSSNGFAFETPGRHTVTLRIVWSAGGVPCGVQTSTDVWVDFPQSEADNQAAALLLHPEVGMYVALGGGADHLHEAVARLDLVTEAAEGDVAAPAALRGFEGLPLPTTTGKAGRPKARRGASRRKASARS